jgi:hypothetical protein
LLNTAFLGRACIFCFLTKLSILHKKTTRR